MRRREFLKVTGLGAAHFFGGGSAGGALMGCGSDTGDPESPLPSHPLGGYFTNLAEQDYLARVRGRLPADLRGVLFRNGPGLFERAGVRRSCLVDGDGAIHAYRFGADGVRFQCRFVRTAKFVEEEAAGRFLYDSWTTKVLPRAPGIPDIRNQAGVSVRTWDERLFAFDEGNFPYELARDTLDTLGEAADTFRPGAAVYAAHPKKLAGTGEWVHMGLQFASGALSFAVFDPRFQVVRSFDHPQTPNRYIHDFFVTPRYIVALVQPAVLDLATLLAGNTVRESLVWTPSLGAQWLVFDRGGATATNTTPTPTIIEGPAAWMWHSLNAYERDDGTLVCEWIGYDDADHFLADDAPMCAVTTGVLTTSYTSGKLRRTVLDPAAGTLVSDEILAADGDGPTEFPIVNPHLVGVRHRYAYVAQALAPDRVLTHALARVDVDSGAVERFDFGSDHFVGEPIFAPKPGVAHAYGAAEPGWILAEVTDIAASRGSLAIFDAEHLADGPVATVELEHHLPIKFHGEWSGSG